MKNFLLFIAFVFTTTNLMAQPNQKFFLVKTTGDFPFLEYGIGDDRLGGAKMTYLDTAITLMVVDSFKNDYKVQLSRNHSAWIDKNSTARLPARTVAPFHLTGSWKVWGDSTADYVAISIDDRLPYRSHQQLSPSKIVVDIFGATSNTNWITQLRTVKEIKNVYYEQTEDDVMRATIELRHTQHWGHTIYYDSATRRLTIKVKRQPLIADIKKLRIAIDAGHGGTNSGASGVATKILEKDYTLRMAKELQTVLKTAGIKNVYMTRSIDTTLEMVERLKMLKSANPDLLISIHLNSAGVDSVKGTSTYYRYIGYRTLSTIILNQMLKLGLKEYGNIGNFNFSLNGPTDYPNCLVEVAFLSNKDDEKKIRDPKFQKAVAQKIYLGISDWLKSLK
ncbi:MAG: N-acetylmuramoyl-L-alanine amidase [Gemmatimonadaceae bacterium]|nr:N-acetylmuramoyl-L-alanine amidase [Chitinophagaceae bacterium]